MSEQSEYQRSNRNKDSTQAAGPRKTSTFKVGLSKVTTILRKGEKNCSKNNTRHRLAPHLQNSLMGVFFLVLDSLQPLSCLFFLQSASLSSHAYLSDADQSLIRCCPTLEPLLRFVLLCCSSLFFFNLH